MEVVPDRQHMGLPRHQQTTRVWKDLPQQWLDRASPGDLGHILKLRIPEWFIDAVPREQLSNLCFRVAWH